MHPSPDFSHGNTPAFWLRSSRNRLEFVLTNRWLRCFLAAGYLALLLMSTQAGELRVDNSLLALRCGADGSALTLSRADGTPFFRFGSLLGSDGSAKVIGLKDPLLGKGQAIELRHPAGHISRVALFPKAPFALVQSTFHNDSRAVLVTNQVRILDGALDWGVPADNLVAFGTGGLKPLPKAPGSYMWITVANPQTGSGVVAGWVTSERGSGVVSASANNGVARLTAHLDHGRLRLKAGHDEVLETFVIGWFDDARLGMEAWADLVAKANQVRLPPQPAGYCTWYSERHGGAGDAKSLVELARFATTNLTPFGFNFVQIDDGWQDGQKTNGPRKNFTQHRGAGPYPAGMKATAAALRGQGMTPGIWFMPFAGTWNDPWFADKQAWFAHREDGKPYDTDWGGTCLDMTHPAARAYLQGNVRRLTHDWGYRYLKLDGLWTGSATRQVYVNDSYRDDGIGDAVLHDPDKTNLEALRDGLRLVRKTTGRDVFLLGCCAPQNMRSYGGAFGLVDAMRIGPDNGANWKGLLRGPTYGTRNYHLHGRVWYNDPDPVYVRPSLPINEAQLIASWVAISGQLYVNSDWLPGLPPERLEILKRTLAGHGERARPVDLFEHEPAQIWVIPQRRQEVVRRIVGLFNWTDQAAEIACPVNRLGLNTNGVFTAHDFWDDVLLPRFQQVLRISVPPHSCRILAIAELANRPQLISTSRHVTQGMVDVVDANWDSTAATLNGRSRLVAGDPYELRILLPASATGDSWAVKSTTVPHRVGSSPGRAETTDAGELLRLRLLSPETREVSWSIQFQRTAAMVQ